MPETFSSEIGNVHERHDPRSSFTDEFRGASDSVIERDRPVRPSDAGRRARRVLLMVVLLAAAFGGGGWALWYWSEPIGEWIASWRGSEDVPAAAPAIERPEPQPSEPEPSEPEPSEPEPSEPSEPTEAPVTPPVVPPDPIAPSDPNDPDALPVEPLDTPPSKSASVTVGATSVRGRIASTTVSSRLATVDAALEGCWASAVAKPETKRPATVNLRFGIKWNGRAFAIAVDGDAPKTVLQCVRTALPSSGWPQPRDGGEAQVTRSWSLQ